MASPGLCVFQCGSPGCGQGREGHFHGEGRVMEDP